MLVTGDKLAPALRREVLAAFGYRWTRENHGRAVQWYGRIPVPTAPLVSDAEWLASYAFHVTARGTLDGRRRHCEPAYLATA